MASLQSYRFGHIEIDGRTETRDLIVLPGRVVTNWWRKDGHSLVLDDLVDVLDELPLRLIVGAGADSRMQPDPEALNALRERGIEVEVLPTAAAVERYRGSDPAVTAAALHLTC
jgi:hypothetical protein